MADPSPFQPFTDIFLLADRYDRRARMAPGFIVTLPLTVAAFFISEEFLNVFGAVGIGFTVQLVSTVILGNLSSIWGKKLSGHYRPTEEWLMAKPLTALEQAKDPKHRKEPEKSAGQLAQWRLAAEKVTGIGLEKDEKRAALPDSEKRLRAADVSRQLNLRVVTEAPCSKLMPGPMCRIHEEEYGFARNLKGLWPAWYWFTTASVILLILTLIIGHGRVAFGPAAFGLVLELLMLGLAAVTGGNLEDLVETTARRYAGSLLNTTVMMAGIPEKPQHEPVEDPQRPGE